uniref:FCH domain-containing protein n=1 Tax=Glossina morsitans morsitans TaxID=37546 RepID=A0A1B0F9T9_GLOMM
MSWGTELWASCIVHDNNNNDNDDGDDDNDDDGDDGDDDDDDEDQYDNLAIHTSKGIEFLDKYANFIRDRLAIETEYAAKLR